MEDETRRPGKIIGMMNQKMACLEQMVHAMVGYGISRLAVFVRLLP